MMCKVTRINTGLSKFHPRYFLHMEESKQFLLSARKRKGSATSNYLISTDTFDLLQLSELNWI